MKQCLLIINDEHTRDCAAGRGSHPAKDMEGLQVTYDTDCLQYEYSSERTSKFKQASGKRYF